MTNDAFPLILQNPQFGVDNNPALQGISVSPSFKSFKNP